MILISKAINIVLKSFSIVLISLVVVLAVLLVGVRIVGFTPYTVLSGSMEPAYHVGSLVYVSETDPADLKENDTITYHLSSGAVATHRIVEVLESDNPSELSFITKGDANSDPDGTPVPASALIGKVCFSIPYLGYLSDFIKSPYGLIVVIGLSVLALLVSIISDLLFPNAKQGNDTEDKDTEDKDTEEETLESVGEDNTPKIDE